MSADNTISFSITATWIRVQLYINPPPTKQLGVSTRVWAVSGATGWKQSGENTAWKFMTSIAIQPANASDLTTGNFRFNGSSWTGIRIGIADANGKFSSLKPFTSREEFQSGTPCVKPADVVDAAVNLPDISVNIKLRVLGKYSRTPDNIIELIGSLDETVTKKIKVTNSPAVQGGIVTLNFTPPNGGALTTKQLVGNKSLEIPFSYKCVSIGEFNKQFRVIYSENETATVTDAGNPASAPGAFKYVSEKDIVQVLLKCLKDLDYTAPAYQGAADLLVGQTGAGSISFTNNSGKLTYTATSSNPKLLKIKKGSGAALNGETEVIATTLICPTNAVQKEVTITIEITNGTSSKTETIKIPVKCKAKTASVRITPTPITLTGTIGSSTNTQPLTISNTGEVDSVLEYQQLFVSTTAVDLAKLNPTMQSAGAVARPQAVVVPPNLGLTYATGFSPSGNSDGSLTVLTAGVPVSSPSIPISYYCSSNAPTDSTPLPSGNGYQVKGIVNIVYKTGATNDTGQEILENAVVNITATCNAPLPKPSATFPSTANTAGGTVNVGQTAINTIRLANTGEVGSSLEWRVISVSDPRVTASGSGNLPAGSSFELQATLNCTVALAGQQILATITIGFKEFNASGVLEVRTKDVPLSFECKGMPSLEVNSTALTLAARVGKSVSSTVSVRNSGSATGMYVLSSNQPWIQVSGSSLELTVNSSGNLSFTVSCSVLVETKRATLVAREIQSGITQNVTVDLNCKDMYNDPDSFQVFVVNVGTDQCEVVAYNGRNIPSFQFGIGFIGSNTGGGAGGRMYADSVPFPETPNCPEGLDRAKYVADMYIMGGYRVTDALLNVPRVYLTPAQLPDGWLKSYLLPANATASLIVVFDLAL